MGIAHNGLLASADRVTVPIDQIGAIVMVERSVPRTLGPAITQILNLWPLFRMKISKKLSTSPGAVAFDPAGGTAPMSTLQTCYGSSSLWQIL